MNYSKLFPKTRREDPKDGSSPATKLLVRAGFIDQISRGIWTMATLGLKVRRNIERIVREEMEKAGAIELELPILQPRELWDETKRWDKYMHAQIAFHLRDRKNVDYILAPTAEEVITDFARKNVRTVYDLPITLWQMSPKFRDELRPRQGIIRGREFVMKDAYSFDSTKEGMLDSYEKMDAAYNAVFTRCGFNFIKVEADSGSIGGSGSAEFMAVTQFGEDTLLYCTQCGYGGNQEKAKAFFQPYINRGRDALQLLETPNVKTVEQLEVFTKIPASKMVKTIVLIADEKPVIVSMRGDLEISEVKLAGLLSATSVETAPFDVVERVTNAPVGFAGPINLYGKTDVPYFFDYSVEGLQNFLCGANKQDVHYIGVNSGRDFPEITEYKDLSKAIAGQHCSNCQEGVFEEKHGIELGHIFQLQQVYSRPMKATFKDNSNEAIPYWMGCYGIGVSRIIQAIVEQNYDDRGIIWPFALAPFKVIVIPVKPENDRTARDAYNTIREAGIDTVLDDRDVRIGEKLTDAELQGWPIQVVVGRSWESEQKVEVRWRDTRSYDHALFSVTKNSLPSALLTSEEFITLIKKLQNQKN